MDSSMFNGTYASSAKSFKETMDVLDEQRKELEKIGSWQQWKQQLIIQLRQMLG
jgi:hypothetical protein